MFLGFGVPEPPSGLFRSAEVKFEGCGPRGEVEAWREAMSMGAAEPLPAMLRDEGGASNNGKEASSKSGSRRALSRLRLVVGLPTSIGFLNQGRRESLSFSCFFATAESQSTGVTGVESREAKRD